MADKKQKQMPAHVVIFVEGDTDEVFFKALLEHYRQISTSSLLPCEICNMKGVSRYTSKLQAKLKNELLPASRKGGYAIHAICCSYDTDVFEVRNPLLVDWTALQKSVNRMGIEKFIRIGVKRAIEDWILDDLEGVCHYLKLKDIPKSLKGSNGNAKLIDLYAKVKRMYQKGYAIRELIASLDMDKIRLKHGGVLADLETALGFEEKE